jgi:hypothetical protein
VAQKYGAVDKILNGNSFSQMMQNELEIKNYLNKIGILFEQILFGFRTF